MEKDTIKKHYDKNISNYRSLAENVQKALTKFLIENGISFLSVSYRIKEFNSYFEKIERKAYENPFDQIEDFCGLRIICFYPADLKRIAEVIHKEFEVIESIDKSSKLEPDRFGYRSNHYIVKIRKEWSNAPNYRGLEKLKMEIQVRTILMHSWADIEHKLAYKKKEQIPEQFRRKLYQLSALLEIADGQFQELKNEKERFKESLIVNKNGKKTFDFNLELNLDSLQAYLDFTFPNRSKMDERTRELLDELIEFNLSLKEFEKMRIKSIPIIDDLEKKMAPRKWAQVGIVRAILDVYCDSYWEGRTKEWKNSEWGKIIIDYRKIIGMHNKYS